MLIRFRVCKQKVMHDLREPLIANSYGVVQGYFELDRTWNDLDVVAVFKNSSVDRPEPVRLSDTAFNIPAEVLKPGKLYVTVIGFGKGDSKRTTQQWDIQQAITISKSGALSDCRFLRDFARGSSPSEDEIATDKEVEDMLDEVFPKDDGTANPPKEDEPETPGTETGPAVSEDDVATDEEVQDMLDEIFGKTSKPEEGG